MMRLVLLGSRGQVGWELRRTLATIGEVIAPGRNEVDLTDPDSIVAAVNMAGPGIVVNAAAYTAVDKAESDAQTAMAINGIAPGVIAEAAKRHGALVLHYSTDYVFDGTNPDAYSEVDTPNPLNVYGSTKLAGERAIQAVGGPHLILRTSWVYGMRGTNFLLTILRRARERAELRVIDDQTGAPTWSRSIAEATAQILAQGCAPGARGWEAVSGTYHLTSAGRTTWHGFAGAILDHAFAQTQDARPAVVPISSAEYPTAATRPKNSVLSNEKLTRQFGLRLPTWADCLRLCLDQT
jgi:dTDP-4-dehydrorhamnose reductase